MQLPEYNSPAEEICPATLVLKNDYAASRMFLNISTTAISQMASYIVQKCQCRSQTLEQVLSVNTHKLHRRKKYHDFTVLSKIFYQYMIGRTQSDAHPLVNIIHVLDKSRKPVNNTAIVITKLVLHLQINRSFDSDFDTIV